MIGSLKDNISMLKYKGCITEAEYLDFIKKIDCHDRELYDKAYAEGKNHQLVAEIKIDADTMSKMLDEKLCELRAEISGMRNATIDEFVEKLYNKSTDLKNIESDDYGMLHFEDVYEIAEQMKGGAK